MGKIKVPRQNTAANNPWTPWCPWSLEQYRGVFEKIYIFSPSVNIDDGWIPVKVHRAGAGGVEGLTQRRVQDDLGGQNLDVLDLEVVVLSVAPAGCAPAFSDHSAVVTSANSISITRFSCGGSILPQRRMPTMVGRSSTSA